MVVLDSRDKKILFELDVDCRQSNAEIGKKLGVSKEVVNYRISKLVKDGLIPSFSTHINMTKLGFRMCKLYLQLQTPKDERELIDYFMENPDVFWLASCEGHWNIIVGTLHRDILEFHDFIHALLNKYSKSILRKAITISIRIPEFPRKHFWPEKAIDSDYESLGGKIEFRETEPEDELLLKTLANNARMPTTEIASKTKLSVRQVIYRMKKLKQKKIINSFRINLDLEKIDYLYFKSFVSLQNVTSKRLDSLTEYCRIHPNITYLISCVGSWDIEIDSEMANYKEFNAFVKDFKEKFSDIIMSHESVLVSKEHRMDFIPGAFGKI